MHISEGVLTGQVLIAGGVLTVAGTAVGLKKMDYDRIAMVGILSAAFFVASLIHVNIGPASAHLMLNGIVGLMLGWMAFPAILISLMLQAIFFQFGGITTLGVNTLNMALPALICHFLFKRYIFAKNRYVAAFAAFGSGFLAVLLSGIMLAACLIFTQENFVKMASIIVTANLPVMIIEGIVTIFCVSFLIKIQPALLLSDVTSK